MHYYSHHIADFNNATRHLTRTERSLYIELLWLYYDKEDPLPNDMSLLARLILAPGEEDSIKQILEEFFTDLGQGYINARCDVEIAKYHAKADRAIRANKKRWGSNNDLKSDADQIPTNNQQPLTNNDKPKKKNGHFVPPTLDQVKDYWREKNLNGDPEHFFDHFENCDWRLSSGRGKVMKKWRLAANNWSRNQATFDPKSGGSRGGRLQLPRDDEGLWAFAKKHDMPSPGSLTFKQYRSRLEREIDKRFNL